MNEYEVEINEIESLVNDYIELRARISLARIDSLMAGEGCLCRNCLTQAVSEVNSFIQLVSPVDTFDECGQDLLFELDDRLNIHVPRWYFYTKGGEDGDS